MERSAPAQFDRIAEREQGLRRSLTSRQLAMIAIGGAIGTGLFLGSGFAIGLAGPAVLISYLIGAVITLLLMGCMAEMTVAHPTAGSFGAWAEFYLSPLAGFLVRIAYWAGVVLALGTEVSAVAVYMRFWFPAVPGWLWIAGFSVLLVLVNAFNVRHFGFVEYAFSALKVSAILAFLALGAFVVFTAAHGAPVAGAQPIGFSNYTAFGGFFPRGVWGMWVAVLVSLFSYFSIEMIAVAAGEAKDPQRAITQAFRATMLRLVLFYVLTLALMLAIVPWTATASGAAQSPFVTVMQRTHIPGAAGVVNFVILIAALSAMNSQLYITARMLFSLARSGFAPRRLGSAFRKRSAGGGAACLHAWHCAGGSAEHPLPRAQLPADACALDVRPHVHLAHDLRHAPRLPRETPAREARVPHVGLSLDEPCGRGTDGGGPRDHMLRRGIQAHLALWHTVSHPAEPCLCVAAPQPCPRRQD